jgi:hypothetical protein
MTLSSETRTTRHRLDIEEVRSWLSTGTACAPPGPPGCWRGCDRSERCSLGASRWGRHDSPVDSIHLPACEHLKESRGRLRTAADQLEWRVNGGNSCMGQGAPATIPLPALYAYKVAQHGVPHQLDTLATQLAAHDQRGARDAWRLPEDTLRPLDWRRRCSVRGRSPVTTGGTLIQADS